jgi:hypothetical protein
MLWQRPVRPEQAEKIDEHSDHTRTFRLFDAFQSRWSEGERWNLAETQKILLQSDRISHSRFVSKFGLEHPDSPAKVERVRFRSDFPGYAI